MLLHSHISNVTTEYNYHRKIPVYIPIRTETQKLEEALPIITVLSV